MDRQEFDRDFETAYSVYVTAGDGPRQETREAISDRIRAALARIAPPAPGRRSGTAEPHMALVDMDADVVVAGGGMAGVCAAVAAARHGARTVLIQDRSRLGGNSSSEVRMHIVGANWHKNRPGWREGGLLEEFRLDDAVNNPQRCFELWDLLLYDKVISEPGLTLLLDSAVFAAETTAGRIARILARCDKTEHIYRIDAKIFCDCSGDSRLALEAGADMRWGREARSEYGESLAPEEADAETLGSSILFTSRQYPQPMPFRPPQWARKIGRQQLKMRTIRSWEYGYWWIEWGGHTNTVWNNELIRFELLSIVMGVWDHIKNSGEFPGSANYALQWVGMLPGKRENRRILGDHVLTEQDLLSGGDVEDAVAIGGWPMDDHPPGGFDRLDHAPGRQVGTAEVYNIPLRSLYSRTLSNLMMAGRNISASHVALTSTRVQGTCSVMGQAVGTAAAVCVRHGITPRQLYENKNRLRQLQQVLLRDDQTIRGLCSDDPADLARQARVKASSECNGTRATFIINGFARDIPKPYDAQPEQDVPLEKRTGPGIHIREQLNHWAGKMAPEGAWIELSWDQAQQIRDIQITFDTGFHRELTLTASDSFNQGIVRAPQPETVRDYRVLYRKPGDSQLQPLIEVANNHQRVNRHRVEPVVAESIRIHVTATNGDGFARIFEVRCYQ